ncbi:MAG: DNA-binding protein [Thermodesulfobacteriota bacterium]
MGQSVTVCGKVANTYYSRFVEGKPTFINFGRPYPNHVFSIAIMGADRAKFDNAPEDLFEGKSVCVTGLIEAFDNKPLIVVRDRAQIRWAD